MRKPILTLLALCASAVMFGQDIPLVYSVENTAAGNPDPVMPEFSKLTYIEPLTDPFEFSDGSGRALEFSDWSRRRGEIKREIEHYEIGDKPAVPLEDIQASMNGNTISVTVTVEGRTLTLTATISYPSGGTAPYPLMIGADNNSLPSSLFSSRNIATMNFTASQVNGYSQFGGSGSRGSHPIDKLYNNALEKNGAYSHWAWGFSRILDGLQILGPEVTKIDMAHIGVTGCSYAGKMALFLGAFDERVALTIAQESGGGGAAAWRVTRIHNRDYPKEDAWEGLDNTDYNWFMQSLQDTFNKDKTFYLPYDHHELVAMCCPRAVLMLGNPNYKWLADGSGYVSMEAARKVWAQYGIADRCGYSIVGGHDHCNLPQSQYAEVEAFLDRFMLGKDVSTDNITKAADYKAGGSLATPLVELGQWMDWWGSDSIPKLPNGKKDLAMYFGTPNEISVGEGSDFIKEPASDEIVTTQYRASVDNEKCPDDPKKALVFKFNVKEKQDFYIYAYVNCQKSKNDAFYIAFDDQQPVVSNGATTMGKWAWKNLYALTSKTDQTTFVKNLDKGEHTLYVYAKEIDAKIGLLCVSNVTSLSDLKTELEKIDLKKTVGVEELVFSEFKVDRISTENGLFSVTVSNSLDWNGTIELFDYSGRSLSSCDIDIKSGNHTLVIPAHSDNGEYILRFIKNNGVVSASEKILVK